MPILFSNPFSSVKITWFTNKAVLKFNVVLVIMIEQGHSKTHNTCYISFVIFIFLDYLQIPNKGQTLLYKWNVNSLIGFVKMQTFFSQLAMCVHPQKMVPAKTPVRIPTVDQEHFRSPKWKAWPTSWMLYRAGSGLTSTSTASLNFGWHPGATQQLSLPSSPFR